jgi:hypothetical protein
VFKRNNTKEVKMVCKICLAEVKGEAARLGGLSSPSHRQKSIAASSYNNNTSYTPCTVQRQAIKDRRTCTIACPACWSVSHFQEKEKGGEMITINDNIK